MPVSLCDWRIRIGRFIPRQPAKSDECCHGTRMEKRWREREKERKKKKEKKKKVKKKTKKMKRTLQKKEKNKQRKWALQHYKKRRAREKAQKEIKRNRLTSEKEIKEKNDELPKKTQHAERETEPTDQETCVGVAVDGNAVNTEMTSKDQAEDSFNLSTYTNNQTHIVQAGPIQPRTSIEESRNPTSEIETTKPGCSQGCYAAIAKRCRNCVRRLKSQSRISPPQETREKRTSGIKNSCKRLWKRFVTKLHLTRSGDIETNPGPKSTFKNEFDKILRAVVQDITGDDQIEALGRELGFQPGTVQNYIKTNMRFEEVTSRGTLKMLRDWHANVGKAEEKSLLREALVKANLRRIADEHLPSAKELHSQSKQGADDRPSWSPTDHSRIGRQMTPQSHLPRYPNAAIHPHHPFNSSPYHVLDPRTNALDPRYAEELHPQSKRGADDMPSWSPTDHRRVGRQMTPHSHLPCYPHAAIHPHHPSASSPYHVLEPRTNLLDPRYDQSSRNTQSDSQVNFGNITVHPGGNLTVQGQVASNQTREINLGRENSLGPSRDISTTVKLDSITSDTVNLSWDPVRGTDIYVVTYTDGTSIMTKKVLSPLTTATIKGLKPNTNYQFRVQATSATDSYTVGAVSGMTAPHLDTSVSTSASTDEIGTAETDSLSLAAQNPPVGAGAAPDTAPHLDASVSTSASTDEIGAAGTDSQSLAAQKPPMGAGAALDTLPRLTHDLGQSQFVTEVELYEVSRSFPHNKYHEFCCHLSSMDYNQADAILVHLHYNYEGATRKVLADWKTNTGGRLADLCSALVRAGAGGIAKRVREGRGAFMD